MRIIIVGAGEVGTHIANLLSEDHDVAVIELDPARCKRLDQHNVLVVQGNGSHPEVLEQAGLRKASMLIAVTKSDSVNILACLAARLAGVEKRVARIEAKNLNPANNQTASKLIEEVGIELVVDPDQAVAAAIEDLLDFGYPGVAEHAIMGDGEVLMLGAQVNENSRLADLELSKLAEDYEPEWPYLVGAISRGDETHIPRREAVIMAGDIVRAVCLADRVPEFMADLGLEDTRHRRILIIGGGRTGESLATRLAEKGLLVRLVEKKEERVAQLLKSLPKEVMLLQGDVTEMDFLDTLPMDRFDAVLALTGQDETNIMACLYAKSKDVRETITLLHSVALRNLAEQLDIDVAFSPRTEAANEVLKFVLSRSDSEKTPAFASSKAGSADDAASEAANSAANSVGISKVATFLTMDVEVLEYTVEQGSKADGQLIKDIGFGKKFLVGAMVRNGQKAVIARGEIMLREGDHLVVFAKYDDIDTVSKYFCSPAAS